MTPYVPPPFGNQVVAAVFAIIVGGVASFAFSRLAPTIKARIRRAPTIAGAVIAICVFAFVIQTRATDRMFRGYFSFKTPRERLQDHFAEFDEKVARDPEIRKALAGFPDPSIMLADFRVRGIPRLDDATIRQRAQLMRMLLSQLSDHAAACILKRATSIPSDREELEQAMVKLEAGWVAEWMQVLYQSMLAEVRKTPTVELSAEQMAAAYQAFEAKAGPDATRRVEAGLAANASISEFCWAVKTMYEVAPTLPEPHATVLLRFMAQGT